jgi:hypothetical protein
MIAVKRLEIVIEAPYGERVTDLLTRHGLTGWTLLRGATGAGERGPRHADELSGIGDNHLILSTCPAERLEPLIEDLRILLERHGGMCLVSDAMWLQH